MKTIGFWIQPNQGFKTVSHLRDLLRDFHKEHRDIRVDIVVKTRPSMWKSLFNMIKRPDERARPEIVQIPHYWTAVLAQLGVLQDLAEGGDAPDLSEFFPQLLRHCREDYPIDSEGDAPAEDRSRGSSRPIFSVPWWMELQVLYFRRDVLEKMRIDPENSFDEWESFEEVCAKLSQGWASPSGFSAVANANRRDAIGLRDVAPSMWSHGGRLFSRDHSRTFFQREEALRGIASYVGLLKKRWMPLSGPSGLASSTLFDGYSALQFSGRYPRIRPTRRRPRRTARRGGADLDYSRIGVASPPAGPKGSQSLLFAQHLGILKGSHHPREARLLLDYLTSAPKAGRYAEKIGALPSRRSGFEAAFKGNEEHRDAFLKSLAFARTLPNLFVLGTLESILDKTFENVARSILQDNYSEEFLKQEILHAATETDYILSLYGNE